MFRHVVDSVGDEFVVEAVEHIADGLTLSIVDEERIDKLVAHSHKTVHPFPFEKQEHLVLNLQVGKGEFRGAVLVLRRWHQFVQVFLEVESGCKHTCYSKQENHRKPQYCSMVLKKRVYLQK